MRRKHKLCKSTKSSFSSGLNILIVSSYWFSDRLFFSWSRASDPCSIWVSIISLAHCYFFSQAKVIAKLWNAFVVWSSVDTNISYKLGLHESPGVTIMYVLVLSISCSTWDLFFLAPSGAVPHCGQQPLQAQDMTTELNQHLKSVNNSWIW